MSRIETPELTRPQARQLSQLKRHYGSDNDWTPVVHYLDPDIQTAARVVSAMQIQNMLICAGGNMAYGAVLLAAGANAEGVTLDEIREYEIVKASEDYNQSIEVSRERVTLERMAGATEHMRSSGLINTTPDGRFKLSAAALKYWDSFEAGYEIFHRGQKPPTPVNLTVPSDR